VIRKRGEKAPLESSAGGQSTARGRAHHQSFTHTACPLRREQVTTQLGVGSWHHGPKQRSREPLSTRSGSLCGLLPLNSASAEFGCLSDDVASNLDALLEQHVLVLALIVYCINRLQGRIELVELLR
jgi:hypothetical protein